MLGIDSVPGLKLENKLPVKSWIRSQIKQKDNSYFTVSDNFFKYKTNKKYPLCIFFNFVRLATQQWTYYSGHDRVQKSKINMSNAESSLFSKESL